MSIPLPSTFRPVDGNSFATGQSIREGSDAGAGELDLVENLNFAWAHLRSELASTWFRQDAAVGGTFVNYAAGAATALIRALWTLPGRLPWSEFEIHAFVENTSGSDAATLRFDLQSDPHPGSYVDINVPAGTGAWTPVTGYLTMDTSLDYDTVRMRPLNGATGELRVHSVLILPRALTAIPAAAVVVDADVTWRPIDTTEADGSAGLSVPLRRRLWTNLEAVRRSRLEAVVGWSEYTLARTLALEETGTAWRETLRIPFRAGPDHTALRWALHAQSVVAATAPEVRLRTGAMEARGLPWVVVTAAAGWTSPYTDNAVAYDDTGMEALTVAPGTEDELIVEQRESSLHSLTAWLAR